MNNKIKSRDLMKQLKRVGVTMLALGIILTSCIVVGPTFFNGGKVANAVQTIAEVKPQQTKFNANGTGVVAAAPNLAIVTVGVSTVNADVIAAQSKTNTDIGAVIAAIKELGIDEKDIQTSRLSIDTVYDYSSNGQESISGYRATNMVTVHLRDLTKAGDVITRSVGAGANQIDSIQFTREDNNELYLEALAKALADARAKAEKLAGEMNAKVVGINLINEVANYNTPVMWSSFDMEESAKAATPVEAGLMEISASITVEFVIE